MRAAQEQHLTDRAASLTFYGLLALFPAMICLVALVGVFGQYPQTVNTVLGVLADVGARAQAESLRGTISDVVRAKGGATALLGVGLLATIWAATGYVAAYTRAANAIYGVRDGRPFWKLRPLQILLTMAMIVMVGAVGVSLALTGGIARAVGSATGIGSQTVTVWDIVKWPFIIAVVVAIFSVLDWAAPDHPRARFRLVSAGGCVGVALAVGASAVFGVFLARFGDYNATYGSLGTVIGFLMWLWLCNIAMLVGIVVNADRERARGAVRPSDDDSAARPDHAADARDVAPAK